MSVFSTFRKILLERYFLQQRDVRRVARRLKKYYGEKIPEEFLDPYTEHMMVNPVYAPELGGVVEHRTICIAESIVCSEKSRLPSKAIPCRPLSDSIHAWLEESMKKIEPEKEKRSQARRVNYNKKNRKGGIGKDGKGLGGGDMSGAKRNVVPASEKRDSAYVSDGEESLPLSQKSPTSDIDSDMEDDLFDDFAESLVERMLSLGEFSDEADTETLECILNKSKAMRTKWMPVLTRKKNAREAKARDEEERKAKKLAQEKKNEQDQCLRLSSKQPRHSVVNAGPIISVELAQGNSVQKGMSSGELKESQPQSSAPVWLAADDAEGAQGSTEEKEEEEEEEEEEDEPDSSDDSSCDDDNAKKRQRNRTPSRLSMQHRKVCNISAYSAQRKKKKVKKKNNMPKPPKKKKLKKRKDSEEAGDEESGSGESDKESRLSSEEVRSQSGEEEEEPAPEEEENEEGESMS